MNFFYFVDTIYIFFSAIYPCADIETKIIEITVPVFVICIIIIIALSIVSGMKYSLTRFYFNITIYSAQK